MRVHPISLALQYLKGRRSWSAAPYYGGAPFRSEAAAIATLTSGPEPLGLLVPDLMSDLRHGHSSNERCY
jgi:hypothetical protein